MKYMAGRPGRAPDGHPLLATKRTDYSPSGSFEPGLRIVSDAPRSARSKRRHIQKKNRQHGIAERAYRQRLAVDPLALGCSRCHSLVLLPQLQLSELKLEVGADARQQLYIPICHLACEEDGKQRARVQVADDEEKAIEHWGLGHWGRGEKLSSQSQHPFEH